MRRPGFWRHGLFAGIIGYAVVVLFYVVLNLVQNRNVFFTPHALGRSILGHPVQAGVTEPGPILIYNGLHLVVFGRPQDLHRLRAVDLPGPLRRDPVADSAAEQGEQLREHEAARRAGLLVERDLPPGVGREPMVLVARMEPAEPRAGVDEDHRRPVVHLAHEQAAGHLRQLTSGLPVEHLIFWASVAGMPDPLVERHIELLTLKLPSLLAQRVPKHLSRTPVPMAHGADPGPQPSDRAGPGNGA